MEGRHAAGQAGPHRGPDVVGEDLVRAAGDLVQRAPGDGGRVGLGASTQAVMSVSM